MRLPQHLLESQYFLFQNFEELCIGLGEFIDRLEFEEIKRLSELKLPPITSRESLAVMLGINPGLIWSFQNRPRRHYRSFSIKKGKSIRSIDAPKVALKIVQKWISLHLQRVVLTPDHVFGFVPGKSHIGAAALHCGAKWVYSVDVKGFFPSTPKLMVSEALISIGYGLSGANLIADLCCIRGFLAQGAPTSPVLSNMVFSKTDEALRELAVKFDVTLTRYADDIVYSGTRCFEEQLRDEISALFTHSPWKISKEKERFSQLPGRLKVHGLLVHSDKPRLTKGYRNRIRALQHLIDSGKIRGEDFASVKDHLQYAYQIDRLR